MTVPFLPSFPCFAVLEEECRSPVIYAAADGKKGFAVITDEDLLRRFRQEQDAAGPTIRFDSAGQLALYLSALPADVTHIAFDPSERATMVSAAELYEKLLESLK